MHNNNKNYDTNYSKNDITIKFFLYLEPNFVSCLKMWEKLAQVASRNEAN